MENVSQILAQITLCSDHTKYNLKQDNDVKQCCNQALNELKNIFDTSFYAKSPINCHSNLPDTLESPYNDYQTIKEMMNQGSKHIEHHNNRKMIVFFLKHCIKRKYYFHFKKCTDNVAYIVKISQSKMKKIFNFYNHLITNYMYIKRKSLIYLTFKLYLIFESSSYLEFYFIRSFPKNTKNLYFWYRT